MSWQEDTSSTGMEEANCHWQWFVHENPNKSCNCRDFPDGPMVKDSVLSMPRA